MLWTFKIWLKILADFERPYVRPWTKIKESVVTFGSHEHDQQVCEVPCGYLKPLQTKVHSSERHWTFEDGQFVNNFVQKTNASAQLWWEIWPNFPLIFCGCRTKHLSSFSNRDSKKSKIAKKSNHEGEGWYMRMSQAQFQPWKSE